MTNLITRIKESHGTLRVPWLTLGFATLMVGLYLLGPGPFELLLFDKTAIMQGEIWRFFTGHLVHCNLDHLFWDVLALSILGAVIETHSPKHLIPSFVLSCIAVGSWLMVTETKFATYCGLSGALNGLLVLAAVMMWKTTENNVFSFVLLGTIGKIIYELVFGHTIFTDLSLQAVPSSHAVGFVAGIIYLWVLSLKGRNLFQFNDAWSKLRF